jgi:hypothetical protein
MITFPTVEDYLEVLAGYRDPVTNKVTNHHIFLEFVPIVNLARYDVKILESMALGVAGGHALTERQGDLAVKIVLKYQRQLAQKSIDVAPVETPAWRKPLRKMDYSRRLYIDNDELIIRFPYDNGLIDSLRGFTKESQGHATWNRESRVWQIGLTEYNLSWLYAWAQANQFEISSEVTALMNKIAQVETQGFAIELTVRDNQLTVTNAPESLSEQVAGIGLQFDNLLKLIDASAVLGYTVDQDLAQATVTEYGAGFYQLLSNRETQLSPNITESNDIASVLDYADRLQRWPVVFYEPDLKNRMLDKLAELRPGQFLSNNRKNPAIDPAVKYIHTTVSIINLPVIPLIVSGAGMLFGGDKQMMMQHAKKVVYCVADVYNKKK